MKTVLVTGAASGIGYHIARIFALNNYVVFMVDYNYEELERSFWKIMKERGPSQNGLYYYQCDVRDPKSVWSIAEYIKDVGRLDILINNAGIACNKELARTSNEEWRKLIDTNLVGPINLINQFFPTLKESKGHIVNVSSGQAFFRLPSWGAYSVTKVALGALSELLSFELSKYNIKVTTVYPFMVNTPFYKGVYGETVASRLAMQLIPLYSNTPEHVAKKIFNAVEKNKRIEYVNPINWIGVLMRSVPPVADIVTYISSKILIKKR